MCDLRVKLRDLDDNIDIGSELRLAAQSRVEGKAFGFVKLIGFIVLTVAVYELWSPARRSQEVIETCATYWHTIDFLWVLIFALLYVMR